MEVVPSADFSKQFCPSDYCHKTVTHPPLSPHLTHTHTHTPHTHTHTEYDQCKRRLLFLDLPGVDKDASEHQKLLQISALMNLHAELMVRSAGVLLKFVEKRRLGIELEECTARVPLLAVKNFSL